MFKPRTRVPQRAQQAAMYADKQSVILSLYFCLTVTAGFIAASEGLLHWFIVPVILCGFIIGIDGAQWVSGRVNIFDPVGVVGLLGLHFFFLAPLLHVHWDSWMYGVEPPPDWREWLGWMATLNMAGLLAYRFARNRFFRRGEKKAGAAAWTLDRTRFYILSVAGLILSGAMQVWFYAQQGGIEGYIQAFSEEKAFQGSGWIFTISESFPILLLMVFAVLCGKKKISRQWAVIIIVLCAFFLLRMFFGGLRGSRSNIIWSMFWALGIIHFWIRPVTKKVAIAGCVLLVGFMYVYGFYKSVGVEALEAFESSESREDISYRTRRTFDVVVLGDLARSDVQSFILYQLVTPGGDYEYAWGRTYLGAMALLIPQSIWPDRPPTKVKEGTDIQYGMGYSSEAASSRIYGLSGEAMLNFSPLAVPFTFILLGLLVTRVRRWVYDWSDSDPRLLLLPFLVNLCFIVLVQDSDVILFILIKNFTIPGLVVFMSSRKLKRVAHPSRPGAEKDLYGNMPVKLPMPAPLRYH